mmetsp:Transcript_14706/g.29438  ORF Transcript_14706/g.29438 Transcript_14706/m.29438 type:complete len:739 (+) Transcript_14706:148-2364(+)
MTAPSSPSNGNEGCRCLNKTAELASLTERACTTSSGAPGVTLTLRSGSCAPLNYGSNICQPHDLVDDATCDVSQANNSDIPSYCFQSWCYVDVASCAKTTNAVYRSSFFPANSGAELFYSYDTCNSTTEDWLSVLERDSVGAVEIKANVPAYQKPMLYKRDGDGVILATPGEEYYNNSVPYEGVYIDYVSDLVRISNGDIQDISYTYKSMGSVAMHPSSHYTAAVQDIENGLADMSVGPFWITGQRLKMSAFTVPLIYDKTVLVIPKPRNKNSLSYQTSKVLAPFTAGLWGVVILVIVCTSLLSVWFAKGSSVKRPLRRRPKPSFRQELGVWSRLSLDSILEKGLFFFSGGVGQDEGSSLPYKLLLFGFGFFILITVSSYVANLAAFLTRSVPDYIATMEGAVKNNLKICGHPALAEELTTKWPDAKFVFHTEGNEFFGLLDDYRAGKCDVLAVGREDTTMDLELLNQFCDEGLVYTNSLVMENPIAFPVSPELASGLSYWILNGDKYRGVNLQKSKEKYIARNKLQPKCNVELSAQTTERNVYAQIMPSNMFFPIIFWLACAVVAVTLQIVHMWQAKNGRKGSALIGRVSTLNLFKHIDHDIVSPKEDDDVAAFAFPRARNLVATTSPASIIDDASCRAPSRNNENDGLTKRSRVSFREPSVIPDNGAAGGPRRVRFIDDDDEFPVEGTCESAPIECETASPLEKDEFDDRIRQLLDDPSVVDFLKCCKEMKELGRN